MKRLLIAAVCGLFVFMTGCNAIGSRTEITLGSDYSQTTPALTTTTPPTEATTTTTPPAVTEPLTTTVKLPENPTVECEIESPYAAILDVDSGEIVYAKNIHEKIYPASTTKLLTAITALKYCDSETVFTAGSELELIGPDSSKAFIQTGNQLTVSQLIDGMMIASGNDAAYILAANTGRLVAMDYEMTATAAVEYFVSLMNDVAKEIGMENSNFVTPDGYFDENHYTTVYDMLILANEAIKYEAITTPASKPEATTTYVSGQIAQWKNSNALINQYNEVYSPECTGLKTGFCDEAGYCLIATAKSADKNIITAVFGGEEASYRWEDSLVLINQGLYS